MDWTPVSQAREINSYLEKIHNPQKKKKKKKKKKKFKVVFHQTHIKSSSPKPPNLLTKFEVLKKSEHQLLESEWVV